MAVLTIVVSGAAPPNPTRFAGCREGVEVEGQAGSLDGLLWVIAPVRLFSDECSGCVNYFGGVLMVL
jgi:hypothetical protein